MIFAFIPFQSRGYEDTPTQVAGFKSDGGHNLLYSITVRWINHRQTLISLSLTSWPGKLRPTYGR